MGELGVDDDVPPFVMLLILSEGERSSCLVGVAGGAGATGVAAAAAAAADDDGRGCRGRAL